MSLITLTRVYDATPPYRTPTYLVDRLWPRGISKQRLDGVVWYKQVAPSNKLRQWFHANLEQWAEFSQQYQAELEQSISGFVLHAQIQAGQPITLLYGSKELQRNHAVILRDFLLTH